jgi:hypothetical protein
MSDERRQPEEGEPQALRGSAPFWLLPQLPQRRNWWQRVDWPGTGGIITVLVGALGLLLTGIATYYGALVSHDQLDQSRSESDAQARSQASRVALWVEWNESDQHDSIHVLNRSADPVYAVVVTFSVGRGDQTDYHQAVWTSMPPCSEILLQGNDLRTPEGSKSPEGTLDLSAKLRLTDRNAVTWERQELGRLLRVEGGHIDSPEDTTRVLARRPMRASSCSDEEGSPR